MFKVPDWEKDVPKSNINLKKKTSNKKQLKNDIKPSSLMKVNKVHTLTQETKVIEKKSQAKKRKHNGQILNNNNSKIKKTNNPTDIPKYDTDKPDELILNAKKKKFYEPIERDDVEDLLFREETIKSQTPVSVNGKLDKKSQKVKQGKNKKINKQVDPEHKKPITVMQAQDKTDNINRNDSVTKQYISSKKQKLKAMLQNNRNPIIVSGNKLRERMLDRLKAAQFRFLNEKLYTSSGTEAKELFQSDPDAFHTYHQGYQQQLKKWPVNPLDVIAKRIQAMPKTHLIADMGCGEAALSKRVGHKVRSFDLVSTAPGVEICDMAHTPLLTESMDAVVYCLALMGTELTQYLVEANRVLKMSGHLLIAEVESRFDDVEAFTKEVMKLGFKLKNLDKKHKVFFFMEFVKIREPPVKKSKLPVLTLKPCLYKRR